MRINNLVGSVLSTSPEGGEEERGGEGRRGEGRGGEGRGEGGAGEGRGGEGRGRGRGEGEGGEGRGGAREGGGAGEREGSGATTTNTSNREGWRVPLGVSSPCPHRRSFCSDCAFCSSSVTRHFCTILLSRPKNSMT